MKAYLANHRQSTRKTRLLADLVRGKGVAEARHILHYTDKKGAPVFLKLINSAVANARSQGVTEEGLFVKEIAVNQGVALKRIMPQARGSAHSYKRNASHISVVLGAKNADKKVVTNETGAKTAKKAAKKARAKKTE
ncbi:MAG: 50S ribosomal protein L22 [Candidatus Pacebacteria bacterium]|nr:50S ribosomal protein L22 [Candidatus Paceibacterota bacterium]